MKLPANLPPEAVVALVDSREQTPWDLSPLQMKTASLPTADYSLLGLESEVGIERKSLPDLVACCGVERERFTRELARLQAFRCKALIVEATWGQIEAGEWRSKISPRSVMASLLAWIGDGIPVVMAESHENAGKMASRILYLYARRRWRELRAMATAVEAPEKPKPKLSRNAKPRETLAAFDPSYTPED
jgi:DNA excision repair protein ERCC-4